MGFWVAVLTRKAFLVFFFFYFTFLNYNLGDAGRFYIADSKFSTRKLGGSYT